MKTLKVALIGTGKVSTIHADAFKHTPGTELVAVCGTSREKAQQFAAPYSLQGFDSVQKMIETTKADIVSICTPHPRHAEVAVPALEMGCHILVEKPLASSLEDCDAILQAAERYKRKVGVISQRRYYPSAMRMKNAITEGKIGNPILGVVTWLGWRGKDYYESDPWRGTWDKEGGGVLVNQLPHQLDMLLWYMGDIEELYGTWANLNHPYIEVDDTALAIIKFKNGALGNILASNSQNPALYGKVHVFGKKGASVGVQTDGGNMFIAGMNPLKEAAFNDLWTIPGEETNLAKWKEEDQAHFDSIDPSYYFHQKQIADFVEAIEHDRRPIVDGHDGRKVVELFTAIYRCQKENRPLKFPL
ncbi:Gfo/Idh/MocA family protein [Entomobacter blattae]|uniref:Inositol 2-dehydrogenase/D-chiro-inositol 3-dehydrogenase n=1 Tax=Entomobacter blattae TaxID=2762277 RepID=A0A7H1NRR9_9PROT|nr:Gfo/Idh/MocA family oxidoreductase [Entomobacter blattae]QNT78479.1 Inositol 2-dehydrogenase/D-chiro-inositol 3-dehydrogenase [Entomobacter blattae]